MGTVGIYPQQIEVSYQEATAFIYWVARWLKRDLENGRRLQPIEVLGSDKLMKTYKRFYTKVRNRKPGAKHTFKITLTGSELIAIHTIINDYPLQLYNLLSQVERKVYNYDQMVEVYQEN